MEAEPQLKPILRFHFSGACFSPGSEVSSLAAVSSQQEQSSFSRSLSPGSYTWEESDAELDTEILERKACGGGGVCSLTLEVALEVGTAVGLISLSVWTWNFSSFQRREEGREGREERGGEGRESAPS